MKAQVLRASNYLELMKFLLSCDEPLRSLGMRDFLRKYYLGDEAQDGFIVGVFEDDVLVQAFLTVARKEQLIVRGVYGVSRGKSGALALLVMGMKADELGVQHVVNVVMPSREATAFTATLDSPPTSVLTIPAGQRVATKAIWLDMLNRTVFTEDVDIITASC